MTAPTNSKNATSWNDNMTLQERQAFNNEVDALSIKIKEAYDRAITIFYIKNLEEPNSSNPFDETILVKQFKDESEKVVYAYYFKRFFDVGFWGNDHNTLVRIVGEAENKAKHEYIYGSKSTKELVTKAPKNETEIVDEILAGIERDIEINVPKKNLNENQPLARHLDQVYATIAAVASFAVIAFSMLRK